MHIYRKTITGLGFLLVPLTVLGGGHDCSLLEGTWTGEVYNYEEGYYSAFSCENSSHETSCHFKYSFLDGTETDILSNNSGRRDCDGEFETITYLEDDGVAIAPVVKVYRILELTESYFRYITVVGHYPGVEYEAYKR